MRYFLTAITGALISIGIGTLFLPIANEALGAPATEVTFQKNVIPLADSTYTLGTTTKTWLNGFFDELCLAGTCKVAWPAGGGGGSISTSSIPVAPNLAYWTSDSTLSDVATGTLSETVSGLELSATRGLVGGASILSVTSGFNISLTASTTNWNGFYDTPSTRITAGNHIDWTTNTLNVVTTGDWTGTLDGLEASAFEQSLTAGEGLTRTLNDFLCDTGSSSVFGCLTSANFNIFNNKLASTSIDTSAELATIITDETGTDKIVFSASPTFTGTAIFADYTAVNGTTTNATSTNVRISNNLSFGGVSGTTWGAFCTSITGGAGLCDGTDDGGAGGGSSNWLYNGSRLSPSTTVGIGVFASSTISDLSMTTATTTNLILSGIANKFLKTNAIGLVTGISATGTVPVFNAFTAPDTGGNAWVEPYAISAINDIISHFVYVASSTSAKAGFYSTFHVPANFTGTTASVTIYFSCPVTTGNIVWDIAYRAIGGDDTESLDQATAQESVTATKACGSALNERQTVYMALTASNFSADDTVEIYVARDGADANDTGGAGAMIHDVVFQYQ